MRGNLGLFVSSADRARLAAIIADRNSPQKHVWRAQVVLLTGDRLGTAEIMRRTGWPSLGLALAAALHRGGHGRLLRDKTRPSRIPKLADAKVAEVVRLTMEEAAGRCDALDGAGDGGERRGVWPVAGRIGARSMVHLAGGTASPRIASGSSSCPTIRPSPRRSRTWSGFMSIRPSMRWSVDRREVANPGTRSDAARPADEARPLGTMTHDYKRNGTTTLFAALNVSTAR
jgi:hypothetical protein